ncbi:DUF2059 domain-containing protein [Litoribrevibacter euphylliae]|uniref:DUF2059 domain-containing protein n=1 Tax=Litoribrevibacter euphylliae TaxID=1834034 RepID=A0ABV7HEC8_9GAMM
MIKLKLYFSFILLMMASSLTLGAAISNESLDKVMKMSGLTQQIAETPAAIIGGLAQARAQGTPVSDDVFTALSDTVNNTFHPTKIEDAVKQSLKSALTEEDAKKLFSWYDTALGKKITDAEVKATSPEAMQSMMQQAQQLMSNQERVQIALEMLNQMKVLDKTLASQEATAVAVYAAMSSALAPDQPVNTEAYRQQFSSQLSAMKPQLEQMIVLGLVYTYQDFSVADIKKYIEFNKTPAASKLNQTSINGMNTAISSAANSFN